MLQPSGPILPFPPDYITNQHGNEHAASHKQALQQISLGFRDRAADVTPMPSLFAQPIIDLWPIPSNDCSPTSSTQFIFESIQMIDIGA